MVLVLFFELPGFSSGEPLVRLIAEDVDYLSVGLLPLFDWHVQYVKVLFRRVAALVDKATLATLAMLLHVGWCAMGGDEGALLHARWHVVEGRESSQVLSLRYGTSIVADVSFVNLHPPYFSRVHLFCLHLVI